MKIVMHAMTLTIGMAFFSVPMATANSKSICAWDTLHSSEVTYGVRDLNFSEPEGLSWLGLKKLAEGQFEWSFGSVQKNLTTTKSFSSLSSSYDQINLSNFNGSTYAVASEMPDNNLQATWVIHKKDSVNGWQLPSSFQFPISSQATDGFVSGISRVTSDHSNNLYLAGCVTYIEGSYNTYCLVRKSTDDGATWKTIYTFPTNAFSKIVSLQTSSKNQIFVIGEKARRSQNENDVIVVKASMDSGMTWTDFATFAEGNRTRVQDGAIDSKDTFIILGKVYEERNGSGYVCYDIAQVISLQNANNKAWDTYKSYFPSGSCGGDGKAQVRALPAGGFVIHSNNGPMLPPGVSNGQLRNGTALKIFKDGNFQRIDLSATLDYDVYPTSLAVSDNGDIAYSVVKTSGFKKPVIEIKKAQCSF